MNKANTYHFNIYQQKAIQTLKHLSNKYSEEILIDSLFSKSQEENSEKDVYCILDDLKKNVSIEDLTSFLYNIMNGEKYETILFSSEIQTPLLTTGNFEENEKNDEDMYTKKKNDGKYGYDYYMNNNYIKENIDTNNEKINNNKQKNKNGKNIIRIKLNGEYSEKDDNETISNRENDELSKEKKYTLNKYKGTKTNDTSKTMLNKPIIKFNTNEKLDIFSYKNNISNLLEFITVTHKSNIEIYNNLIQKLIKTHNLNINEVIQFTKIRNGIKTLIKKKSNNRLRNDILNGIGIVGKHYNKNSKGEIYFYKPKCFRGGKKIKFVCSEGSKCGSFGYYNIMTKKFIIKKEHKLDFESHKIYKVKDRYFIKRFKERSYISDIQEYILLSKYE